jgi:hypothetical protein
MAMENITLRAHYDGTQIQLDEPFELQLNTKLLVIVIQSSDSENPDWFNFSAQGLELGYGNDEPEYSVNLIKEQNPSWKI